MKREDLFNLIDPQEDWEWHIVDDADDDLLQYLNEPKRQHLVKKVRTGTLMRIAELIRKYGEKDDPRALEILRKAKCLQNKEYRSPSRERKKPVRLGGDPINRRLRDFGEVEPDETAVPIYRPFQEDVPGQYIQDRGNGRRRISVPGL